MKQDYKKKTIESYDTYVDKFSVYFDNYFSSYLVNIADSFLSELLGKKILDIGSGPGHYAEYFQSKGFDVLCGDLSSAMVKMCQSKGLKAEVIDIEDMPFAEKTFDGVCANMVLLHVPREKVKKVAEDIQKILKPGGLLFISVQEGEGEGFVDNHKYPDTTRWFTYFSKEELMDLFSDMEFLKQYDIPLKIKGKYAVLNYFFRKNG